MTLCGCVKTKEMEGFGLRKGGRGGCRWEWSMGMRRTDD